jgi:hypothetical protein
VADEHLLGGDQLLAQQAADDRLAHGAGADHGDAEVTQHRLTHNALSYPQMAQMAQIRKVTTG